MSIKQAGKIEIIIRTINAYAHIEILNNFLIPFIENWFGDDEIIFRDDHASCHRGLKLFFRKGI